MISFLHALIVPTALGLTVMAAFFLYLAWAGTNDVRYLRRRDWKGYALIAVLAAWSLFCSLGALTLWLLP